MFDRSQSPSTLTHRSPSGITFRVTEFKAKCLDIVRRVHDEEVSYTITKRDKVVATLQPVEKAHEQDNPLKGSVVHEGDLISPIEETWQEE